MKDCQDITELVERSKIERISLGDRMSIGMHSAICKNCRQFFRDSDTLDEMMQSKRFKHLGEYSFTTEEKEKLKILLQSKSDS
ncbi:hypothetical protein OAK35_02635 [Crocinitomicaceae bacterium]|nr:hypothetical protein [Crocinitomicaceae bacterium]MDC0257619.1 hypothetical protein [Crocinitomicaceae bacterium]|mmetsp:Transcript_33316/g.38796  ORF Transcript_33316/g.38796 Transcript_33316/m.38796 type:complete len:83 (-) Transcript_33316:249-497(-)